ncbi:MAG: hypothetical protein GEU97_00965 [Actinophytocola sp.]|nr:hypothetical protein [Actinophytocola sp.]
MSSSPTTSDGAVTRGSATCVPKARDTTSCRYARSAGDGALVGVVVDPAHGETFTAIRGDGAYRNGEPPRVNQRVGAAMALVGTGFSYQRESRHRQGELVARLLPMVRDARRTGSCAEDLCAVAAGRLDAFLEDELAPWYWAVGALIAREAGATVSLLREGADKPGLLVAAPTLHRELAGLIDSPV